MRSVLPRLIWLLWGLVAASLWPGDLWAIGRVDGVEGPPTTVWGWARNGAAVGASASTSFPTKQAAWEACTAYAQSGLPPGYSVSIEGGAGTTTNLLLNGGSLGYNGTCSALNRDVPNIVCPVNSSKSESGSSCFCDQGYRGGGGGNVGGSSSASSCAPYTCLSGPFQARGEGPYSSQAEARSGAKASATYCDAHRNPADATPGTPGYADSHYGCSITERVTGTKQAPDGKWYNQYASAYGGSVCNDVAGTDSVPAAPEGPASAPPIDGSASMPAGTCGGAIDQCPGTVNGTSVCVACSRTISTTPVTSVASNASGVATSTGVSKTTVDCQNGVCTTSTTTTTTTASGTVTSTTSSTGPASGAGSGSGGGGGGGDGDSAFGGSCAGGFTCTGDAIQCAIARDQHVRHCQFSDIDTPESIAGKAYMQAASQPAGITNPEELDIGARFTAPQANPFGDACPGDIVINSWISLPLSQGCDVLQLLGKLLIGFTIISCAGWLMSKGV